MTEVYCPKCEDNFPEDAVCDHYKALNFKPGENPDFFIRNIMFPPKPRFQGKRIGTSAGNTRTKNTVCKECNKDLNGLSFDKMQQHVEDHKKENLQERLF